MRYPRDILFFPNTYKIYIDVILDDSSLNFAILQSYVNQETPGMFSADLGYFSRQVILMRRCRPYNTEMNVLLQPDAGSRTILLSSTSSIMNEDSVA
jgi:hypothetical protein